MSPMSAGATWNSKSKRMSGQCYINCQPQDIRYILRKKKSYYASTVSVYIKFVGLHHHHIYNSWLKNISYGICNQSLTDKSPARVCVNHVVTTISLFVSYILLNLLSHFMSQRYVIPSSLWWRCIFCNYYTFPKFWLKIHSVIPLAK